MNGKPMTESRMSTLKQVAANRQFDITVVLENVNDPHNIGAVMRSCDAVGISEIYIIYTEDNHNLKRKYIGNNSASGAKKWVKSHFFDNLEECIFQVKKKYGKIFGTHLSADSKSLFELKMDEPIALMFGNEQKGISNKALQYLDGNFIIPQYGMVQSLNISVACAVTLFEASRQRYLAHKYSKTFDCNNVLQEEMFNYFKDQHYEYVPDKSK